ncbi:hypothetical protein [Anaeromicropila herbilytica]|uniref:Uncharacterized protein n=1 Tax=Anaeromicropila herbilytica TaxID=2785025 RepID=A0A7R7EP57_9FIRM|nr:hypothetical protein [Anaeromicropila herbilytica]BCN32412.1 hypothetical protein bsdtb5_37070 [Anaeromicropila herbilytica]
MDSIFDMMHNAANVFLFILAITLFLLINNSLNSLLLTTKNNISSNSVLYEQQNELVGKREEIVKYEELIGILMSDITRDMRINSLEIKAEDYDYLQFDFSVIPQTSYKITYERDSNGAVTKIIYTSIN